MKECRKCRKTLPLSSFSLKKNSSFIVATRCDSCRALPAAQWLKNNPEKAREALAKFRAKGGFRRLNLARKYRLTPEQYDQMLEKQGGTCAICRAKEPGGKWSSFHVDHDHKTNVVRGLLCTNCNRGLGYFGDDRQRLLKAASYLAGR